MTKTSRALVLASLASAAAWSVPAQQPTPVPPAVQAMAQAIAGELAARCPLADPGDVTAFSNCRAALFGDSALRASLPPVLLWGRQNPDPKVTLRQTNLTQFAPDTWTHLYAPLFMFNGRHKVEWVPEERKFVVRLEAAFRNRLPPGQFPYPFWHEEAKWSTYENANGFLLWVDAGSAKIQAAQFSRRADNAPLQAVQHVEHKFDGKWLWTDGGGRTQPAVTLFDGLYRPENPFLKALDRQYRDLAVQLRESQCASCHVPNNPDKMSRLVLLSTPAHAAGEIDRLIKSVKEDRMPMDENRLSYALSPENKKWLLESAEAFRSTVQSARSWEQQAAKGTQPMAWQPAGKESTQ
ncbi:MAG TPA: hypothetical protein VLK85_32475 [Ramlibacter sp.]|nr:hypothetical protein [Ramlibacter sp.]